MLNLILAACLHATTVTRLPGGYITLALPPSFTPSTHANGLGDDARGSLITSQRLPRADLTLDRLPEALRDLKTEILAQEKLTVDGRPARLLQTRSEDGRGWILALDTGEAFDLVITRYREEGDKDKLRNVLLSARIAKGEPDPFDGSPYRFDVGAPLKPIGGGLAFTADGRPQGLPMIALKTLAAPADAKLEASNARTTFERISVDAKRIKSVAPIQVAGLTGFEITGFGSVARTKTAFDALLFLREGRFVCLEAQAVAMRAGVDMPNLRRALFSFRLNTK